MGKWELTMNPVQEWGEEVEDGAVYGVTLRREPVPPSPGEADSGPGSAFIQYRTTKVRRLKAASPGRLVSHLLDGSCQEQDYGKMLLSTYRTFTSTAQLIEMLFQRDCAFSDLEHSECYSSPLLAFVQTWLDEYSEDFRDPPLHPALHLLLDHLRISSAVHDHMRSQPNFCSLAGQAEDLLKKLQREDVAPDVGSASADPAETSVSENSPNQSGVMDFSATTVAEQLTQIDAALFVRVVPFQCLGCVWSQRDKKENMSPTIRATVAQFNAVTSHVIASLLCPPSDPAPTGPATASRSPPTSPLLRARIIERWIKVAQECRRLKNFSSLRAILSALQSNAVYRLRKTWAAVSRESMAAFENLWETFPDENCVLTNKELLVEDGGQTTVDDVSPKMSKRCPLPRQMSSSSGVVPYLGTYLTVLTMLDTALPDTLEGGLINFEKRRREFDVLSQIRALQASCSLYSLPLHHRVAAWLQEHKLLSDQESYELSRQLEPPVDLCSPASWSHRTLTKKLSSLLTVTDGAKKLPSDQISVSSSGSSGSEMDEAAGSIRMRSFHSSCTNVSEAFSSTSSSCSSSSAASSSDSPTPPTTTTTSSSSDAGPAAASPASRGDGGSGGGVRPKPQICHHKRSVSMTSLPLYNRQVADSCIVRVSVDLGHNNGNMYKSILLTSQDKTAQVIRRALEKHHLEHMSQQDFTLTQVISPDRELLIPDKANVFYAMSTTANYDFVLRQYHRNQKKPLRGTASLGRFTK
ncbi:ral guanine nucleotide dissociation stimulator-like 1 [Salarias fasciatus]|uniref:Ral guanine nucleotide dissociation stimulator-like 1 n=1 Tax=Salarias fasciatus TaxID=181472 RepID=A0A672G055_SALFA|nr:ral guanine nucleotide dissociation stimulator-like 1 [Salarias fasciatus]